MEPEGQQCQNWTVNSSQQKLDISALKAGKQYWITVAAVNGAGVGTPSDPHGLLISEPNAGGGKAVKKRPPPTSGVFWLDPQKSGASQSEQTGVLALLQEPLVIGCVGALVWCSFMIAAVCLFRRHGRTGRLIPRHGRAKGGPEYSRRAHRELINQSLCLIFAHLFWSQG